MHQKAVCIASVALACIALCSSPRLARGQYQAPSEQLSVKGALASTWTQGEEEIIAVKGPVTIELDRATLTAGRAVIWLTPSASGAHQTQLAQIALLDNAKVVQKVATRSGAKLFVTAEIRGTIRLDVDDRVDRNESDSELFQSADALRPATAATQPEVAPPATQPATEPATAPATEPSTRPATAPVAAPATEPATAPALPPSTQVTTAPATAPTETPAAENPATAPAESHPSTEPVLRLPRPDLGPRRGSPRHQKE